MVKHENIGKLKKPFPGVHFPGNKKIFVSGIILTVECDETEARNRLYTEDDKRIELFFPPDIPYKKKIQLSFEKSDISIITSKKRIFYSW